MSNSYWNWESGNERTYGYSSYANSWENAFAPSQSESSQRQQQTQDYFNQQAARFTPASHNLQSQYDGFGQHQQNPYLGSGMSDFPEQIMSDPMISAARQIGGQFAEQQKEKLTRYLSAFNLKYYFAVDNSYVGKKLAILLFPFFHKNWAVKDNQNDSPVPAKLDVNAPDLYIPLMAFLTYVLISGFVLGVQGRFSPEQLGMLITNALVYLIFENIVIIVTKYIMDISQALTVWHSLAYSSYKYVGMNISLLAHLAGGTKMYYWVLSYASFVIVFFLLRTVKTFVLDVQSVYNQDRGRKRKFYLLLLISLTQPFLMWWLTAGIASGSSNKRDFAEMAFSGMGFKSKAKMEDLPLLPDGEVDYEALLKRP